MSWIQTLDVKIQAALIASIVTLLGIFFKDYVFQKLKEKRDQSKIAYDVYKKYAEPLAAAAESMFWRLNETFNVKGRAHFLIRSDVITGFEDYKYKSTLYRLASLIGWIYAIKKEQSYMKPVGTTSQKSISESIRVFESALADGPHVETQRLLRLTELWSLECSPEKSIDLSIALEKMHKSFLKGKNVDLATDLGDQDLFDLCRECANFLCGQLDCNQLRDELIKETMQQSARRLSIREAWIYRDWQAGIGELMVRKSESEARDFDVIGFKEFESMLESDDPEVSKWISRIENTFKNLDIDKVDGQDVRVEQIRSTFKAVAKLIVEINNSGLEVSPFGNQTIAAAEANNV
ncbi:hypothetical protein [Marinobacter sp. BSs20148]|uniref:hypothetical protein n=1 Tax=Marinobacter sp. BSs20148 TaxID=490759 RepID=UPI0002776CC5|nr:hypothetical protein [Marinobacter sp. BSs20148]AFP30985.1 hypothetical protein MRBBS_2048 [Marinobacter sp. BSs20148]